MEDSHPLNPTPNIIIANYEPLEVPFEIPSLSNEPSPAKDECKIIPISNRDTRSHVPYSFRFGAPTATVTHKDIEWLSDAGVRGSVSTACHGTFHSQPATLILFTFVFRSGNHGFRFKNANIKINFSKHYSSRSISRLEGGSSGVPIGTLTMGPSATYEHETTFDMTHRYSLIGNFWSSRRNSGWDVAYWDVKENKRTKQGIPDRLNLGVIVHREGTFSVDVQVTVDTPVMNGVFGFPWSKERPVTFVPGVEVGVDAVRTKKFEDLRDEDWKGLIHWDDEWENLVTQDSGMDKTLCGYTKS